MSRNDAEAHWLILGAGGQIGRALQTALAEREAVTFLTRDEADLSQPEALAETLEMMPPPAAIINAAAYTAVDKAEQEEALAHTINADAPAVLAGYASKHDIPLVHYSTDYVFDGSGDQPRSEDAATAPLSAYGRTKLAGEKAIAASGCKHLIFRTSWVYDADGKNFVNTMLRLGAERESLNIVADQIGAPSYAAHLAEATVASLDKALSMQPFPSGIYHMCNGGETSWHGFAEAIFEQARVGGIELEIQHVSPITTEEYPTPAQRPLNSRLNCSKLQTTFGVSLPDWREGLAACFKAKHSL